MKSRQNNGYGKLINFPTPCRKVKANVVYQGDNLPILKEIESGKIDLIYIDPPFCAGSVFKSKAWGKKVVSFNDEWGGGVQSYIHWLSPRLKEFHRLLSHKGVFCLHLDQRSVHYAKVELDKIFGQKNFLNEVIWHYSGGASGKRNYPKKHNTILIYTKTKNYQFNDDDIRIPYEGTGGYQNSNGIVNNGKRYKPNPKGKIPTSVFKIPIIHPNDTKERIGYPTQKPLKLLDRIIKTFTHKGDMVLDGFCGCGTTISSAQNLGRQWLGIDISKDAVSVIRKRMAKEHGLKIKVIPTGSLSKDNILRLDPFEFERYIVGLIGQPNLKQRGDGGVDGYTYDHIPIQVKKSYKIMCPKSLIETHVNDYAGMWRLNHTCAKLRHHLSRLKRKTWATTKNRKFLQMHLDLFIAYQNKYKLF